MTRKSVLAYLPEHRTTMDAPPRTEPDSELRRHRDAYLQKAFRFVHRGRRISAGRPPSHWR